MAVDGGEFVVEDGPVGAFFPPNLNQTALERAEVLRLSFTITGHNNKIAHSRELVIDTLKTLFPGDTDTHLGFTLAGLATELLEHSEDGYRYSSVFRDPETHRSVRRNTCYLDGRRRPPDDRIP